jgi:hypothetical protein
MELTLGEETITTFTHAVERVAALAHAKLPAELHGHLERAVALVKNRHVFPRDDGKHAQVLSSDGARWYHVNGHCTCMDATKAPQGLCKHRLAFGLYRRASELLAASAGGGATPAAAALPEAPASVNVRLCIGGADVQWTLRDVDEHRLAERLEALLTRFPQQAKEPKGEASTPAPAQTSGETPICATHGPMKASAKAPGTFFCSKKLFDGSYCKERFPKN